MRLARAAVPHLRAQQWGRIVFVASDTLGGPVHGTTAAAHDRVDAGGRRRTLMTVDV